jgi:hypothetical protein
VSLNPEALSRVFMRLTNTYGRMFTDLYTGQDMMDVRSAWGHELSVFSSPVGYKRVAWALENLPERAPNAIQFKNLCRQAPIQAPPELPAPKSDPGRVAAELAKLGHVPKENRMPLGRYDHKAWAKVLIAREEAGEVLNLTVSRMARQALGHSL